jgi:hypothetical protein
MRSYYVVATELCTTFESFGNFEMMIWYSGAMGTDQPTGASFALS